MARWKQISPGLQSLKRVEDFSFRLLISALGIL
jgi:hypothetical protein